MTTAKEKKANVEANLVASQAMINKSNLNHRHKAIASTLLTNTINEHKSFYGRDDLGLLSEDQVFRLDECLSERHQTVAKSSQILGESVSAEMLQESPINTQAGVGIFRKKLTGIIMDAIPSMIGFEVCGTHTLTSRQGIVSYSRYRYNDQSGADIFRRSGGVDTAWTGTGTSSGDLGSLPIEGLASPDTGLNQTDTTPADDILDGWAVGTPYSMAVGEDLGDGTAYSSIGMTIGQMTVVAKERGLKAEWSMEADLVAKAEHGLAFGEKLLDIAKTALIQVTNREIINKISFSAKKASANNKMLGGLAVFNGTNLPVGTSVDLPGKAMALAYAIELEASDIAVDTRFGKANYLITSSTVLTLLSQAKNFRFSNPSEFGTYNNDVTQGNLTVGKLGNINVILDPYATTNVCVLVSKQSDDNAGFYYCPFLPLWIQQGQDFSKGAKNVAFLKSLYDFTASPYAYASYPSELGTNDITARSNRFARIFNVVNI